MANSFERALELLELLEQTPGGLTHAALCRRLHLPSSTCTYITLRLEQRGYLRREPVTRRFQIGLKTVALAHGALRELGFRSMAEPVLYRLALTTGLSAGIGVLQKDHVLLIDRVESPDFIRQAAQQPVRPSRPARGRTRAQRDVGREMPVHTTALGKVLLAYLAEEDRDMLLKNLALQRRGPRSILSKTKLVAELAAIRRQGYAEAEEEEYADVRALGAPIFDSARSVRAAVALNGPLEEAAWRDTEALVKELQQAAAEISRGYNFA